MNTKRSHKIFSLIMLILILGTVVVSAIVAFYNVYDYKHQQKVKEDAYAAIAEAQSEAASSEAASEASSEA